ncbi:MAG: hypothetical protein EAZ89_19520 [Bacteroidetes bacterium]|nr:MAG: hypothetical protein EAZ89_19520 [Bacteroidota bacterium]
MPVAGYVIELITAGAGASLWIVLLILAFTGHGWLPLDAIKQGGIFVLLSPFIYVIGAVIDRLVDNFFDRVFKENFQSPSFLTREGYFRARTRIYLKSDALRGLLEYGKMRIRLCRTWTFNSIGILIAADLWLLLPNTPLRHWPDRLGAIAAVTIGMSLSAWLSFRAWKILSIKEAEFMARMDEELK